MRECVHGYVNKGSIAGTKTWAATPNANYLKWLTWAVFSCAWLPHAMAGCLHSESPHMQVDKSWRSATKVRLSMSCSALRKHSAHAAS